tara:strand:- start:2240 stop:2815 length:576 start_codon:yes stop_codon:yes gene_type:complete
MVRFKILFTLSSILLIVSCSKDDGYNSNSVSSGSSYSYSSSSYEAGGSASTETTTSSSNTDSTGSSSSDSSSSSTSSSSTTGNSYSLAVTAQNSSDYIIDGSDQNGNVSGNDPSISAKVGETLNFDVNASGHPLLLIISSNGGTGSSNLISGVSNNGADQGTISWSPPTAGTYYYICEFHPDMLGEIIITE